MAKKFPDRVTGLYDEAFREKMAATGVQQWAGMDVQLYHVGGVWWSATQAAYARGGKLSVRFSPPL